MKAKKKILLAALIFAIAAAYLTYQFLGSIKTTDAVKNEKTILVAKRTLMPGSKISGTDIDSMDVGEDSYIPASALMDRNEIVGKITKERILEGEIFAGERMIENDEDELAFMVPVGKRAISVNIDQFSGVGDLIRPNDYVDIYITAYEKTIETASTKIYMPETSILLLQDIQVLAVSKQIMNVEGEERKEIPNSYAVTVAVSAEEGEKLVLGEEMGSIKLALRPFGDDSVYFTPGVVRNDLVTDKGKIVIPK
ncbi:MAG TPA: Flp pilus assembly protein CpaB [Clostridia bacterium]|nr:Flp pilus assembly protein CpaB [Clostridia bacterium]